MVLFFLVGWLLLAVAFVAAAAEGLAQITPHMGGLFVSTHDLWYALRPGALVVAETRIESVMPWLWDPVALALLSLPAWALLGGPGAGLAWFCRPHRHVSEDEREEARVHATSVFLYDELTRAAALEDFEQSEDDTAPDHGQDHDPNSAGITTAYSVDDYYADWAPIALDDGGYER